MSDLPHGWVATSIGVIADISSGFGFPQRFQGKVKGDFAFAKVRDISFAYKNNNGHLSSAGNYVSSKDLDTLKARPAPAGSTVFAKIGEALRLNRRVILGVDAILDNNCMAITPRDCAIEPKFLYRFMSTIDLSPLSVATTVPSVRRGDVESIEIKLPPLPEQRRIVAKIDSLTGKSRRARDHLDHIPRLVEKYKQAILAAAFRGDLCTKRRSPKLLPLSEFIDSLDQGWSPKCASEPAGSNDWGVIKTTAIQSVHFLPQENKRLPTDLKPRPGIVINAGDVLTTRAGPRSRVAISCLVNEDHPKLMLCDKAYRLRINQEIADPAFVTYMLNTPQCLSELEVMKTGISDSGLNLTQGKFIALGIPAFSLPEQFEIVRHIQSAFVWIDRLTADATSARKLIEHLDQSVLVKAFKGELVPQDPSDEPASVVLERIRAERAAAPKAKRGRKKIA